MATFGRTDIDSPVWTTCAADGMRGNKFSLSENGTVSKLSMYMKGGDTAQVIRGVIYDDDGADGKPGTWMATTNEVSIGISQAEGWVDFTLPTPVFLTAGDWCLLNFAGATSSKASVYRSTTGGTAYINIYDNYADGAADPCVSSTASTSHYCIYATYEPPAAGNPLLWWQNA